MIDKMMALLKKPTLWQRSEAPFWDDEHISKGMLEAHLNPDWDAASRRPETIKSSVRWLSTLIPAGGKILDLGCGPGLYAKRLSDRGYAVTGVDMSRRSIAYARRQDRKTRYLCQNYLELDFSSAFDAALLIYCDYGALTIAERENLCENVYRALKPGGVFILDVFTEGDPKRKMEKTSWSVNPHGGFWSAEPHICLEATYLYEGGRVSVNQCVVATNNGMTEHRIWNTDFTKDSLACELEPSGFRIKGIYDDICGKPYTGRADTLCFVTMRTEQS